MGQVGSKNKKWHRSILFVQITRLLNPFTSGFIFEVIENMMTLDKKKILAYTDE